MLGKIAAGYASRSDSIHLTRYPPFSQFVPPIHPEIDILKSNPCSTLGESPMASINKSLPGFIQPAAERSSISRCHDSAQSTEK